MKFNFKDYKIYKTKTNIKKETLVLFFNGINANSSNWVQIEQKIKKKKFNYHKIYNKTGIKVIKTSIFKNFKSIIYGITFLMKPINKIDKLHKKTLFEYYEELLFHLLILKLNNKLYKKKKLLSNFESLKYSNNKLTLFKFIVTNSKTHYFNNRNNVI